MSLENYNTNTIIMELYFIPTMELKTKNFNKLKHCLWRTKSIYLQILKHTKL